MKLTTVLLIATMLQVSAAGFAQKITFVKKDATLKQVFNEINKQTGYSILLSGVKVKSNQSVDANFKDASLEEVLKKSLENQPLEFTIEDKMIVIRDKEPTLLDKLKSALTPPTDIIGRVTNEQGEPLNGATITTKRTQTSTLSDANGNFTVRGVSPTDTLIVSYLGYKRAFIGVGSQTSLKVVLQVATNNLDQVVVQAYGETSQRLATGNIGTLTAAQIAKQPVMNVLQALQGQVAGVVVTNTSGYASGTIKVEIRGRNSINGAFTSDPLYIIDGVPITIMDLNSGQTSYGNGSTGSLQSGLLSPAGGQSPFFSINPSDIESIEVLKDADATAIYGSRGANGVILINTKKGKAGKTQFDLKFSQGESKVTNFYPMLNTQQYVAMREEALKNDGLPIDIYNAPDLMEWNTNRYTNWEKYSWGGIGKNTDVQTSLSGGDALTTFRIASGYHYQRDILNVSGGNERASFSFNVNHKSLNQRLSISLTANYTYSLTDQIYQAGGNSLPPNTPPIYSENGSLNFADWNAGSNGQVPNPFGVLLQPYSATTNFLNSNFVVSYELLKGLTIRANLGYNNTKNSQENTVLISSQDPQNSPKGFLYKGYTFFNNAIIEPQIEYRGVIGKGNLDILSGASSQINTTSGILLTGQGYTSDLLLTSINSAPVKSEIENSGQYRYAALFGRINYNLENKYIISFNGRRDGSSRFAPGRQYGNFGSVGGAWIFSEEKWIKESVTFLSFAKLRGSYGTTGSDQIGDYQYLSKWIFGNSNTVTYNGHLPLVPTKHTDSLFQWQVNKKLEVALDLGFFKDRVTFEAAWYRDRCNNQLLPIPTPELTGFTSVVANFPAEVQNTGLEFILNAKIIDKSEFKWSSRFNIGLNRNKLLAYPNLAQSAYATTLVVGQSLNITHILHYTGVDPQTGFYTFEDKNRDGQITYNYANHSLDDTHAVDLSPKFDGGFTNSFTYRNWDLSMFFYFKKQQGANALISIGTPGGITNEPVEVLQNHWQKPGDIAAYARLTTNPSDPSYSNFLASDGVITDASFIRLQNISLSYSLPSVLMKKLGLSNCKINLEGENIFVITKYKGPDPETQNFQALPIPRTITLGLTSNF